MIHLVHMPFGSITRPSLALGRIKAQLLDAGMTARVFNFNLAFAKQIDFGRYEMLARWKGVEPQVGEWLFSAQAFGRFGPSEEEFLAQCGTELSTLPAVVDIRGWLRKVRWEAVPVFLDACVRWLRRAGELRIVAFNCTFFQTIPALALGRKLKDANPDVKLVYGGACFHGEPGEEILRKVPWIDAISTGEADDVVVPLFRALEEGRAPEGLQGIQWRPAHGDVRKGLPARPINSDVLNTLPVPDYDDFFTEAREVRLSRTPGWIDTVFLPFESSRGCWWGEKQHCTFCGLNAEGMTSRDFDTEQVKQTLLALRSRYPIPRLHATDNILSMTAFGNLLPWLAGEPLGKDARLYYCVKANLKRAQVQALANAGIVYVQPGIESLATGMLRAMRKGVTGIQNVFLLKLCREIGVIPFWNLLIRVPGEQEEDYALMADWIPKIMHLWPPLGGAPAVECHRYSPYFYQSDQFTNGIRPMRWYNALYPEDVFDLRRVAYYFEAQWKNVLSTEHHERVIEPVMRWLQIWTESPDLPMLSASDGLPGSLQLTDTRYGRTDFFNLSATEAQVYRAIADPSALQKIRAVVRDGPAANLSEQHIKELLKEFVKRGVALEEDGTYLGLALRPATPQIPLEVRRRLTRPAVVERSGVHTHAGLE